MSSIINIFEGRLGINKTNPIYPLDISGSAKVNTIVDISNSTGISEQLLTISNNSLSWRKIPNILGQAYWIFQTTNQFLQNTTNFQPMFAGTGQPNTLDLPKGLYSIEIAFATNGMATNAGFTRTINYYTQVTGGTVNGGLMYTADFNDVVLTSTLNSYTVVSGGTSNFTTTVTLLNNSNNASNANYKGFIKGHIYVNPTIDGGVVRLTPYFQHAGYAIGTLATRRNGSYFVAKFISADYSNTAGGGIII